MNKSLLFLLIIAAVVALIIAGPLLVIWSLNTLFPALGIAYTLETWVAALILGAAVSPTIKLKKS
jgi:hypothetical protein